MPIGQSAGASLVASLRRLLAAGTLAVLLFGLPATAQNAAPNNGPDELLSAVVQLKTYINPEGRTVKGLGQQRKGSGIVIDDKGLILTIGYLMVEAQSAQVTTNAGRDVAAQVVGYDHDTGFGLLRATEPLKVKPLAIGKSSDLKQQDQVLAASFGGRAGIAPAYIMSLREFAGGWEYLIPRAIFTAPAHSEWSGAALVARDGKLVGVGSLVVGDVTGQGKNLPGNMYVPIDLLPPIMADLLSSGRASGPARPWLGLHAEEVRGRIFVSRVTDDGPAQHAGIHRNDIIVAVNGAAPSSLADYYRKLWSLGAAGTSVPLDLLQTNRVKRIEVKSMNRLDYLRLKSTF
ncbi:MAG: PDZ domain-containing protein [Rhizobiales bacterium]|nr:PDZ domain-containing protein [Hyphomicrobiales bacterium]